MTNADMYYIDDGKRSDCNLRIHFNSLIFFIYLSNDKSLTLRDCYIEHRKEIHSISLSIHGSFYDVLNLKVAE